MKKLIITLAVVALYIVAPAQDFWDIWSEYESYCLTTVPDTINQEGTVTRSCIPVEDENGNICKYVYGDWVDTVWKSPLCKEWMIDYEIDYTWGFGVNVGKVMMGSYNVFNGTVKCKDKKTVTRKHICFVKREHPSWYGFGKWFNKYRIPKY